MRCRLTALLLLLLVFSCQHEKENPDLIPFVNLESSSIDSLLQVMTLEQKLGQLLLWEVDTFSVSTQKAIVEEVSANLIGGLLLNHLAIDTFLFWRDSLNQRAMDGLWVATKEQLLINNQFANATELPSSASIQQVKGDSLQRHLEQLFIEQATQLGINWAPLVYHPSPSNLSSTIRKLKGLSEQQILSPLCHLPGSSFHLQADAIEIDEAVLTTFKSLHQLGLPAVFLDTIFFSQLRIPPALLQALFRQQLAFNGLLFGDFGSGDGLTDLIAAGVDVFWVNDKTPAEVRAALKTAIESGLLTMDAVDEKVKRVLKAKNWQRREPSPARLATIQSHEASIIKMPLFEGRAEEVDTTTTSHFPTPSPNDYLQHVFWEYWREKVYMEAISVLGHAKDLLPFTDLYQRNFNIIHVGPSRLSTFDKTIGQYAGYTVQQLAALENNLPALPALGKNRTYILTIEGNHFDPARDTTFLSSLADLEKNNKVALVYYGEPAGLAAFDTLMAIIQVPDLNKITEKLTAELLFGAIPAKGHLPTTVNAFFKEGDGIQIPAVRLQYSSPESVGILPEKLVGIDAIANTAIEEGIIPGCQVLVAKSGKVIYQKSFGYHTFDKRRAVGRADLYDIASVTKVVGTTLAAMRLFDQGKFKLNSQLSELGVVGKDATLNKVTVKRILTHESGLQPFMPVIPYMLYRDAGNAECDSFFCRTPSAEYNIQLADSFYFKGAYIDTIWAAVEQLPLKKVGRFRYSDVNFMLMQRLVEKLSGKPLDEYLNEEFYHPLGLQHITYKPLDQFKLNQIVPTEQDERWRQRLVHGYVHDETAAIFGGVAGHAGLFANANDLAVIAQLLLNKGSYGGRQFILPRTVEQFTKAQSGTHRGLGFDTANPKSSSAFSHVVPSTTYGHTGFTGTCIWIDPENDLVYIFLSNRLHPSARNKAFLRKKIRERIQEVVYDALNTEHSSWPEAATLANQGSEDKGLEDK